MPTYLITGVAGFIGSALARAILSNGDRVVGVDDFSTGRRQNVAEILGKLELHELDINDTPGMTRLCRQADFVLHQAAIPSVPKSIADPAASNRANIDGTLSVLMAARDAKVKRVVYAASSSAYGDSPSLPKHEEMTPQPISPYAVGKLAGEYYMRSFWQCYGLETVSLRYFNVFGPRQDQGSPYSAVLAKFITQMLRGEQPTIYGDGEQSRDFTYVDNCVEANLLACRAAGERVAGRVFNVACGQRVSLNETVKLLAGLTGFAAQPRYEAARVGDVKHSQADITAAAAGLGYQPRVPYREGLRRTVEWYRAE